MARRRYTEGVTRRAVYTGMAVTGFAGAMVGYGLHDYLTGWFG